ncbi:MAG: hypothetical protein HQL32_04615 [Planctomycetes bacterium]|nr:hypothetical protein [Planctomycetota bacterium]
MSPEENRAFRREMMEAAFLPASDPKRQRIEDLIAKEQTWAEREWLTLVQEDEKLKLALRKVSTPPGLKEKLEDISEMTIQKPKPFWQRRSWLTVAALFVLTLLISVFSVFNQKHTHSSGFKTIAMMAMDDHLNDNKVVFASDNPESFIHDVSSRVPFAVALPRMSQGLKLLGGRPCRWGDCAIIFSRWDYEGEPISILQFDPEAYNMPKSVATEEVCCGVFAGQGNAKVAICVVDGKGFAFVGPLNKLKKQIQIKDNDDLYL